MYFCAERNGGSTKAIDEYTYPSEGGAIEVHLDEIQYAVIIKLPFRYVPYAEFRQVAHIQRQSKP